MSSRRSASLPDKKPNLTWQAGLRWREEGRGTCRSRGQLLAICTSQTLRRFFSAAVGPGDQGKMTTASHLKRACFSHRRWASGDLIKLIKGWQASTPWLHVTFAGPAAFHWPCCWPSWVAWPCKPLSHAEAGVSFGFWTNAASALCRSRRWGSLS